MGHILITGSRGFTGSHLVPLLLSRGHQVTGLERSPASAPTGIPEVACDLADASKLKQLLQGINPTHVIHLAGLSFVGHADEEAFYRVNLFGTLNLLAALDALPNRVQKVVIASSANVYGTPPNVEQLTETTLPAPVNHYANSKLAMEHMVRTWFAKMPVILTRPFNYTGPGQDEKFVIPKIVGHFRRKQPRIELGNLDVSRDFSDVRDVARCYADLLESDAHSCSLNICSGQSASLQTILDHMAKIAGYPIEVAVNPQFVRANEIPTLFGCNARLKEAIGFVPNIPLQTTLQDMFRA